MDNFTFWPQIASYWIISLIWCKTGVTKKLQKKNKHKEKKKEYVFILPFQLLHQICISKLILKNFNNFLKHSQSFSGKFSFSSYVIVANEQYNFTKCDKKKSQPQNYTYQSNKNS